MDSMFLSSITKDGIGSRDSKSAVNSLSDPIPYFCYFNFEIELKNKKSDRIPNDYKPII